MPNRPEVLKKAQSLKLYGLCAHWDEVSDAEWVSPLLEWEEAEKANRGLARRLKQARLKRFKPLSEFDWSWPRKCDRYAIEEWMQLNFMDNCTNLILCGPNGVGKTTIALNVLHQAILNGHSALFVTAAQMLNELAAQDGDNALQRRIRSYITPKLLQIDEIGYLSYSNRHADLLFEVISRRYETSSTIVTTNKPFAEWGEIFPNASCVVSIIDRLVHHSEILTIEADSFRVKEAKEFGKKRETSRRNKNTDIGSMQQQQEASPDENSPEI